MNKELRKVATWFKANKLSLNIFKIKYSLFNSTKKRNDISNISPLHIENVPLKREFCHKILGVYLDENLSWKHHVDIISAKVGNSTRVLYRAGYILHKVLQKQLHFFYKLLQRLRNYIMGQYKQKYTTSALLLSEACTEDRKSQRQIYFYKTTA